MIKKSIRYKGHVKKGDDMYLTSSQAAEKLHLKPNTLEIWRHKNRGPKYSKIGGKILYSEHDIKAYVADNQIDPEGK